MTGDQLDLFDADGFLAEQAEPACPQLPFIDAASLNDSALIDALACASAPDAVLLAKEAGRRRVSAAVPGLEAMCRRLKGFGQRHALREQTVALQALAAIGGPAAAAAVGRIIADAVVQGPGLRDALEAAARFGCRLPADRLLDWLRDADPAIRAAACRCAGPRQGAESLLIELLGDLNAPVAEAAACALGRLGRSEARPTLLRLLCTAPSPEVLNAIVAIADEDSLVQLARLARAQPALRADVLGTLDTIDHPRAEVIAAALTKRCGQGRN